MEEEPGKIRERFYSACVEGEFETVLQLIESGECSPKRTFKRGYCCLHFAAAHGKLDVVRTLIEKYQCNPNIRGGCRRGHMYTSLAIACYYGHIAVVRYLVTEPKCSPSRQNNEGFSPLRYALDARIHDLPLHSRLRLHSLMELRELPELGCKTTSNPNQDIRHFEIVKFLVLECPCQLHMHGKLKDLSRIILHMACKYGELKDVKSFVERGLKPQACDANLLSFPCMHGKLDLLKYLVEENHCDPKKYKENGNTLLHVACSNGKLDVVKYLIQNSYCDPLKCNCDGDNSVHEACKNGNLELIKYLLTEVRLEPIICNKLGNTLLHLACMSEHLESATVEYLIVDKGCDPTVENINGELPLHLACQNQSLDIVKLVSDFTPPAEMKAKRTPIHIACCKGNLQIVQYLVKERHWDLQCEDSDGLTPLHHACGCQVRYSYRFEREKVCINLELVLFLVKECGRDPMKITGRYLNDESSPIAMACKQCDLALLKALTSADVNCRDKNGDTPLHLACKYKAMEIIRYLIEQAKCDPTIQNSKGELPLHVACNQGSLEMVELVSECNVNSRTNDGDTPLHIACKHRTLEVIKYLIQKKRCSPSQHREVYSTLCIHAACESKDMVLIRSIATPENVNNVYYASWDTNTPLHIACKSGNLVLVRFLVKEMCANINVLNAYEKLPLHFACTHGSLEMVELVSGCKNVNSQDSEGDTPLHVACRNGTLKIVKCLTREKHCDPTIQNKAGELCLHISCQRQSLEMLKLVSDCNPNCVTKKWYSDREDTALHIACRLGNLDIAKYLIMEKKSDPSINNDEEELPIHCACKHSLEMVKLTVDMCSQSLISRTTNKGATPLHLACLYGKLETVRFLIEEKAASLSVHDKNGLTPLHYACGLCSYISSDNENMAAIARYMVTRHECNPLEECLRKETIQSNKKNYNSSPLEKAVVEGNLELVKALTSGNLNVDYLNSSGESMLHVACAHHQLDIIEFLVTGRYCNQAVQNRIGELALHIACRSGCLNTVRLVSNCDVNVKTVTGDTPLHVACQHCHINTTEFLTTVKSSNPNIPDSHGNIPLHIACQQNSLALVMLVSNCDVNAKTNAGNTPLHIVLKLRTHSEFDTTSIEENEQIVKYLVNVKQCDLSIPNEHGNLPLHVACQCDSLAMVKLVSNSNVNSVTKDGDTPLHIVIQRIKEHSLDEYKLMQIVEYLVDEKCCDLSVSDKHGNLPLHTACQHDSLALVKLTGNCDVNAVNENGNTPLHIALNKNCEEVNQIVQFLVSEKHSNLTLPDKNGCIPLHIACQQGSLPLVKLVSGCDVNTRTKHGDTPLHTVLKYIKHKTVKKAIVEYLVYEKCCDVNIPNNQSINPIHRVCWNGDLTLTKLLSTTENVKCKDENGNTPLHIACLHKMSQIARFLVGVEASILNVENKKGNTPLHLACLHKIQQIASFLVGVDASIVNVQNAEGNTPLHLACSDVQLYYVIGTTSSPGTDQTFYHLVKCVIGDNTECDVSITNSNNETPLHIACAVPTMPLKVIQLLLSRNKPKLCNLQNRLGDTPLHIACRRTSPTFADYLVKSQLCNADIPNREEELPLHIACQNSKSFNSVIKMLSCQCKLNYTDKAGDTPLHILCRNGNFKAIKQVLSIPHCDTNIQNHNGETPLHLACSQNLKIVKLVGAQCQCSPNIQMTGGDTPLHVACRHGDPLTVKYLIHNMRCNPSVTNDKGVLPLHIACCCNSVAIAKLVSRCDPNLQCNADYEFEWLSTTFTTKIEAGEAPLHIACRKGNSEIISFLVEQMKCNVNIPNAVGEMPLHTVCRSYSSRLQNVKLLGHFIANPNAQTKHGDTPLHIAARTFASTDIIEYLVKHIKCDMNIPNHKGELPLHFILHEGLRHDHFNKDAIPLLSSSANINIKTERGNAPLHIACHQNFGKETVNCLSKIKDCDLNILNNDGEIPLHIACRRRCHHYLHGHDKLNIVKLVSVGSIKVDVCNIAGNTPLHEACERADDAFYYNECLKTVEYLISEKNCNPSIFNEQHELPLHLACRKGHLEIVKLVSQVDDVNSQTLLGNSPLHEACKGYYSTVVEYLTAELRCSQEVLNCNDELPLHLACRKGYLQVVKLVCHCNPNSRTKDGNTPLHEACMKMSKQYYHDDDDANVNLLNFLIEKGCDPACRNNVGKTPLHYLCENSNDAIAIECLLSISKSELFVADNEGQTPIMLTTNLSITKILLNHGADANPLYEMHHDFFKTKAAPPTPLNVLVVGNASMGKTTLIESLKNELCELVLADPRLHSAGIIPNDFESETYGSVTFYDFAGQHEYYASHEAVVHNIIKRSPPVIVLVINITESESKIRKQILYWATFIENMSTTLTEKPHLIVVGSHLDLVKQSDDISSEEKLRLLSASLQQRLEKSPLKFITSIAMDCRLSQSPGIDRLRHFLQESSAELRDHAVMNFTCHCFCVFLQDKLKHFTALPVEHITNAIMCYATHDKASITENFLSTDTQEVIRICEELSNMGHLLLLKNHSKLQMSWVILKKESLLSTVNGTVFAPHSFKQHKSFSSSTGVVPFHKIARHFPRYDPNMIVGFLSYMEFCQEIYDQEVLDLLTPYDKTTGPNSESERYFFFPRLVSIETPQEVWDPDQNTDYGYHWGWMLHCTEPDQFFTPHFLQVLILRLAFKFALTLPKLPSRDDIPAIKRICSVWKKGICWTCTAGVEVVVEVIEQNQAVVVMVRSCKYATSELECIRLRSSVIKKVLQAKKTFCPNTFTAESLIHPQCLQYPLACIAKIILFPLPIVTQAIVEAEPFAVSDDNKTFSVEKLILFEPYFHFDQSHLKTIFDPDNEQKQIQDDTLQNITDSITEYTGNLKALEFKTMIFANIFKFHKAMHGRSKHETGIELLRVFHTWKSHSDGTYQCLRKTLDEFSLFCGRNPLVS